MTSVVEMHDHGYEPILGSVRGAEEEEIQEIS